MSLVRFTGHVENDDKPYSCVNVSMLSLPPPNQPEESEREVTPDVENWRGSVGEVRARSPRQKPVVSPGPMYSAR